jgi:drug/metabolite transporter (DMT)-like permease
MTRIDTKMLGLTAIIAACVFWGTSFYFGKIALRELSAMQVVWWRFALATALLAPLLGIRTAHLRSRGARAGALLTRPLRRDLPLFLLNALVMVPLQFVLQFEGLARTTASSAALLVGVFAPMMALAGVFFARERLQASGWLAVAVSTLGVGVMVGLPGPGRTLAGDLMVVASLVCAVGMVLVTQRLLRRYEALSVTVWSAGLGTLLLLPWSYLTGEWPTLTMSGWTWAALFGLGFGCTAVAFSLWNWGLRYIPASRAGIYVNLEPFFGALLGVFVLHETASGGLVAGGALILGAALIISWPRPAAAIAAS